MADQRYVNLVYQRAYERAKQNGASDADARAFAQTNVSLVYSENDAFDPTVQNRQGAPAYGLYQNHLQGRGKGYTPAQLRDPELNIKISLDELWPIWKANNMGAAFAQNPLAAVAQLSRLGQRPGEEAVRTAMPRFEAGLKLAGQVQPGQAPATTQTATASTSKYTPRMPVEAPITSKFGTPFGMDSGATYQGRQYAAFNKGVDFGAAGGAKVFSVTGGTVVASGDDGSGWGPRVVVKDNEGFLHSYGHLSGAKGDLVPVGVKVTPGFALGFVASGKVGTSTGPHLSYDVFDSDGRTPVDPSPWLGQNVVDPAIAHDPAKSRRPSFAGGAPAPGGASVTTPTGQQPARRAENDPYLAAQIESATKSRDSYQNALTALQQQRDTLRKQLAAAPDEATRKAIQAELGPLEYNAIPTAQKTLDDAEDRLYKYVNANKMEPGVAQASEAALANSRTSALNAQVGLYSAIMQGLGAAFGQDTQIATLLYNAINANVQNQQAYYNALLNKGQIDIQSYASLLTADAAKQAAHVSAAVESRQLAVVIGEQEKWNAVNLINDGIAGAGLPGLPDLNTARQKLGLPAMTVPVNRVDPATFRPENLLARGRAANPIPNPDTTFNPDIASMRGAVQTNQQLQIPAPQQITFGAEHDPNKGVIALPQGNIPASMLGADGELPEWLEALINPMTPVTPPGDDTGGVLPSGAFGAALAGAGQVGQQAGAAVQGVARNPATVTTDAAGQQGFSGPNSFQSGAGPRGPEGTVPTGQEEWVTVVGADGTRTVVRRQKGATTNPTPTGTLAPAVVQQPPTAIPGPTPRGNPTNAPWSANRQDLPEEQPSDIEIDPATGQKRKRMPGGFWITA